MEIKPVCPRTFYIDDKSDHFVYLISSASSGKLEKCFKDKEGWHNHSKILVTGKYGCICGEKFVKHFTNICGCGWLYAYE